MASWEQYDAVVCFCLPDPDPDPILDHIAPSDGLSGV